MTLEAETAIKLSNDTLIFNCHFAPQFRIKYAYHPYRYILHKNSVLHIDCLRDQLKIVIPLNRMESSNTPMRYIDEVNQLSDYSGEIWQKLLTICKISGSSVSKCQHKQKQVPSQNRLTA